MNVDRWTSKLRVVAWMFVAGLLLFPSMAAVKNMAVIAAAGSKLQDVPLTELAKLCKGSQKTWPDGRNFTYQGPRIAGHSHCRAETVWHDARRAQNRARKVE